MYRLDKLLQFGKITVSLFENGSNFLFRQTVNIAIELDNVAVSFFVGNGLFTQEVGNKAF